MANEIDKLVRDRIKNQSVIHYEADYDLSRLNEFLVSSDEDSEPSGDPDDDEDCQESRKKKVTFKNFNLERLVGQGAFGNIYNCLWIIFYLNKTIEH